MSGRFAKWRASSAARPYIGAQEVHGREWTGWVAFVSFPLREVRLGRRRLAILRKWCWHVLRSLCPIMSPLRFIIMSSSLSLSPYSLNNRTTVRHVH